MKPRKAWVLLLAFLTFSVLFVSAAHRHGDMKSHDDCLLCAVSGISSTVIPNAVPALAVSFAFVFSFYQEEEKNRKTFLYRALNRSPPSL